MSHGCMCRGFGYAVDYDSGRNWCKVGSSKHEAIPSLGASGARTTAVEILKINHNMAAIQVFDSSFTMW